MSPWRDLESEMQRLPLDTDTADRLLAGSVAPEDAPPGYAGMATLLAAVADSPTADDLPRESETVALLAAVVRSSQPKTTEPRRRSIVPRLRLATAFATVALAATTGLAFAGSLPGAAQDVASTMLAEVGISVPAGPNNNAGDHPNVRGKSSDAPVTSSNSGKGGEVSDLATSTDLTGVEKGAAISTLASGGQSQAGEHGQASDAHGASVETPNSGGTGTADTASGEKSSQGTEIANAASDDHSVAGSENAVDGQSHRP
jgi:hypothetical protein